MNGRLRAPSPALVISLVALFVALGGTSLAAANYINGKHIKPHSIPTDRLTKRAIKTLHGAQGPRGLRERKACRGRRVTPETSARVTPTPATSRRRTALAGPTRKSFLKRSVPVRTWSQQKRR